MEPEPQRRLHQRFCFIILRFDGAAAFFWLPTRYCPGGIDQPPLADQYVFNADDPSGIDIGLRLRGVDGRRSKPKKTPLKNIKERGGQDSESGGALLP